MRLLTDTRDTINTKLQNKTDVDIRSAVCSPDVSLLSSRKQTTTDTLTQRCCEAARGTTSHTALLWSIINNLIWSVHFPDHLPHSSSSAAPFPGTRTRFRRWAESLLLSHYCPLLVSGTALWEPLADHQRLFHNKSHRQFTSFQGFNAVKSTNV